MVLINGSAIPQRSPSVFLGADLLQSFRPSYPSAYSVSSLGCFHTVSSSTRQTLSSSPPTPLLPQMWSPNAPLLRSWHHRPPHCTRHGLRMILASRSPLPLSAWHQLLSVSPPEYLLNECTPHHCHTPPLVHESLIFHLIGLSESTVTSQVNQCPQWRHLNRWTCPWSQGIPVLCYMFSLQCLLLLQGTYLIYSSMRFFLRTVSPPKCELQEARTTPNLLIVTSKAQHSNVSMTDS